ncbi:amino acid adenylation domain-containing protein [Streptomyces sp. NBC_01136]|uniref:non-ribosomal peptide synthetase n=1 Tax=unclassified Streptomyces TaxID=2593676 RepID=UPI00324CF4C1|nr:amino acid adenylation domain-containing protein [Streptomyces sp. NBC_01136]
MPDAPARPHVSLQSRPDPRPASAAQSALWFNELLEDCGAAHHLPFAVHLHGGLDVAALDRACDAVLSRHQDLSGAFEDRAGAPFLVPAAVRPRLVIEDESPEATQRHLLAPFDPVRGPLGRLVLQRIGPREHRLLVVFHQLVFDRRSAELFVADLTAFYRAEVEERKPELPALSPVEPAGGEEERIAAALPQAQRYWTENPFDDEVMLPGLERTAWGARPGESLEFRIPAGLRKQLTDVADRISVSPYELLVASVHAVLFRYGNTTPVTALDLDTRTPDQRERIGAHVSELPFSSSPEGGMPFSDFARLIRSGLGELQRVRDVPVGRVNAGVKPGLALAPVHLTYHRGTTAPRFPGAEATVDRRPLGRTVRHTLHIALLDGPDGLDAVLQYSPESVTRGNIQSIGRHWLSVLTHIASAPGTALAELPLLDREESDSLLIDGSGAAVDHPVRTVPHLFTEQVARTPDAIAVIHADRHLTYAQLDAAAERLAGRLRSKGIGSGALVAVRASRTERLLVGLLGVLKAGAAYIPLDPEYPAERLDFITGDSRAVLELGDAELSAVTENTGEPDEAATASPAPGDLAYVIYTSGSTGRPKGVQIEHGSLVNLLLAMRDLLDARPGHRWLASASAAFDMSVPELYLALVTGGTIVMASETQTRAGAALRELIARHEVTHMQATPTGWSMLLDAGFDAPGITAITGGEALTLTLAQRLRPKVGRLVNLYGPTETTVWSMADEIGPEADRVTIGGPLANTRVYVLDERLTPVPRGIPGDLYIAGAGLARGYLRRPELDQERFLPDPFGAPASRMYRTGDRVRRRDDGRLEFLGRIDDQIKLRGYRIELGEIESRLLAVPGVDQAAATVREGRLAGYFVGSVEAGELRRALAASLPAYMVPEVFVALDALPTTPNGKLDRSALPSPPEAVALPSMDTGNVLETVRQIWCEVLRIPELGDTEDLFDLGGHSITMTQISARILGRLGVEVPLHAYFDAPTVEGMAAVVADLRVRM